MRQTGAAHSIPTGRRTALTGERRA